MLHLSFHLNILCSVLYNFFFSNKRERETCVCEYIFGVQVRQQAGPTLHHAAVTQGTSCCMLVSVGWLHFIIFSIVQINIVRVINLLTLVLISGCCH